MDYIFGIVMRNGIEVENLKVTGQSHTDFQGFQQVIREYPDSIIVDNFRIVDKYREAEDTAGKTYDWYIIDNHNQYVDKYTPDANNFKEEINATTSIVFVTMAEKGDIDDATSAEHTDMFSEWKYPVKYTTGNIRRYNDNLYRCLQPHTSQMDWTPDVAVSLWKQIGDPTEEWPEWSQPIGAHDAYNTGDKVSHNGKHWRCICDGNVWEPGVYGWEEIFN